MISAEDRKWYHLVNVATITIITIACGNAAFDSPYKPDGSVIDTMCNGKSEKPFLLLKQHETCLMNSILEMLNDFKEIVLDEESSNEFLLFHICIVLL